MNDIVQSRLLQVAILLFASIFTAKSQNFTYVDLSPPTKSCRVVSGASLVANDGGMVSVFQDEFLGVDSNGVAEIKFSKINADSTIAWSLDSEDITLGLFTYLSSTSDGYGIYTSNELFTTYYEVNEAGVVTEDITLPFIDSVFTRTRAFVVGDNAFYLIRDLADSTVLSAYQRDGTFVNSVRLNDVTGGPSIYVSGNTLAILSSTGINTYDATNLQLLSNFSLINSSFITPRGLSLVGDEFVGLLSENLDIFKLIVVDGNNGEISTRPLDDPIANAQSGRLTSFGEDSVAIFTILSNEPNNIGIYNINGSLGRVIDQSNTSSLAFIYGNSNSPSVAYTNTIIQDGYGIRSLFYDPITNTGLSPCESPSGTVPFWVESSAMRSDGLGVVLVRDSVNAILVSPSGTQSVLLSNSELEDPFRAQIAAFSQARTALVIMPLRGSTTTEYYLYSANGSLINSLTLEGTLQSAHPLGGSHLGEYGVMTKVDTNHFRLYQFDSDGGLSRERNLIDYPLLDPTQTIRNSISDFSLGNGDTIAIASSNNEITIHAPDGTILTLTSTGNDVVFNPRFSSDGTFTLQRANISTDPNRIIEIHQNPLVDLIPEAIIDDSGPQLTDPLFLEETYTRIIGRSSSTSDGNILLQEIVPGGSSLSTVATGDVTGFISRISDYDITPYGVVTPISSTAGRLAFFQFDAIVNTSSPLQNSSGLSVQNPVRQELVITLDSSVGQEAELINTNGQMLGKLNLPNLQDGGEIRIARPSYLQAGSYVLRVGERSAVLIVE